jgi:hypothetical protein
MGKQAKTKPATGNRTRTNPITGQVETVPGTKAGKKRVRLSPDHPLRTHVPDDRKRTERRSKSK